MKIWMKKIDHGQGYSRFGVDHHITGSHPVPRPDQSRQPSKVRILCFRFSLNSLRFSLMREHTVSSEFFCSLSEYEYATWEKLWSCNVYLLANFFMKSQVYIIDFHYLTFFKISWVCQCFLVLLKQFIAVYCARLRGSVFRVIFFI